MHLTLWEKSHTLDEIIQQLYALGMEANLVKPLAETTLLLGLLDKHELWLTPEDKAQHVVAFRERHNLVSPEAFAHWLKQRGLTPQVFTQQLGFITAQQRLKERMVSPGEIEAAFINKKSQLDTVTFTIITLPTMAMAYTIMERLTTSDMVTVAQEVSHHPSSVYGGLVGPLPWAKLAPYIRQQLEGQPVGKVIAPFFNEAADAVVILRLLRLQLVTLTPELYTQLLDDLFAQWLSLQVKLAKPVLSSALVTH